MTLGVIGHSFYLFDGMGESNQLMSLLCLIVEVEVLCPLSYVHFDI